MKITALYGSPRRNGNTASLTKAAVKGAREEGAQVTEIVLRDLKISPCLEIYACKKAGNCAISDDFQKLKDELLLSDAIIVSTPVFFYSVSAHMKILMDRCQSLWVKKYMIEKTKDKKPPRRKAILICAGATRGKKLFDGIILSVKYFLDVLDAELSETLLFRELDCEDDIRKHPEYLEQAEEAGKRLANPETYKDGA